MASTLPPFPRLVFTVIEPISLFAGFLGPLLSPAFFTTTQLPATSPPHPAAPLTPTSHVLALQLGNSYLLLMLLGVLVLARTADPALARAYLWALWLGDVGHVGVTCWGMGLEGARDVGGWGAVAWGNVGFTVFLWAVRSAYFAGVFGADRAVVVGGGGRAERRKEL